MRKPFCCLRYSYRISGGYNACMVEKEMDLIANMIMDIVSDPENQVVKDNVEQRVLALTAQFPLYPNLIHLIQD